MSSVYRIGEFAERIGRSASTVRRWEAEGRITARRSPSGQRFYTDVHAVLTPGLPVDEWVSEIGGMNLTRPKLLILSPRQEMVQDLLAIVHTFSCRPSGLRRYEKTLKADDLTGGAP